SLPPPFVLFGPAHLTALIMALATPLALAVGTRRASGRDFVVRMALAALLILGWAGWYAMLWSRGWLQPANELPLNLCDSAQAALIVALLSRNQRAYELG